jgi:hypothetical protein
MMAPIHSIRTAQWRLLFLCVICLLFAWGAVALGDNSPPPSQDFWVVDLNASPSGFRKAHATLRSTGLRSYIYVEDKLWGSNVSSDFVDRLHAHLELSAPPAAILSGTGLISIEERIFSPLPKKMRADDHLIILLADLGQARGQQRLEGFYSLYDQLPDADTWVQFGQHSNEGNFIYLNALHGVSEDITTAVIAHELQRMLESVSAPPSADDLDSWFSEMLAESAMLLTGYPTDQPKVDQFLANTGAYSLVTSANVQSGPQLLFSSYLLDTVTGLPSTAMGALAHIGGDGRKAVETIVDRQSGSPLTFDVVFGNFISYLYNQSSTNASLPTLWNHAQGIRLGAGIKPAYHLSAISADIVGSIAPYAFVTVQLDSELPGDAVVEVARYDDPHVPNLPGSCSGSASMLWKPINLRAIALYAVGCEPTLPNDKLQFSLKIHSSPSLLPGSLRQPLLPGIF